MNGSSETSPSIRIFIGEPLQYRSEYDCLSKICAVLAQRGKWGFVFANFHLAGRQIDLVVFTETTTVVIEVKSYSRPVRGGCNGQWEQFGPCGSKKIGNAYSQVWNARNAIRDEIQREFVIDGYPNGLVIVVPNVPKGSKLATDFKVVIAGLDQIGEELKRPSGSLLTATQCGSLARRLSLEEVGTPSVAVDEVMFNTERKYKSYTNAFRDLHEPSAADLVSDEYICDEVKIGPSEVRSRVLAATNVVQIKGPSGCGKTLLTTSCAISSLDAGCLPIFVHGGSFDGNFRQFLNKEAALLGLQSARSIVEIAKLLGKRIILFLDGYNECPDHLKLELTRSLRAFALRFDAGIVVSTQEDFAHPNLLVTETVTVSLPSDELKRSIAKISSLDPAGNMHSLLQVANSGLEARIVGQVGTIVSPGSSRFGLFDTYARKKLGLAASEGIRILAAIAEALIRRACFSLSVREFDRLFDSTAPVHLSRHELLRAQLLKIRGDRISFVHELFFAAFGAEAAIRSANGSVDDIRRALESPRFFSSRVFILGGIEDDRFLRDVFESVNDPALLSACSRGECGTSVQALVRRKIMTMLDAMVSEAQHLEFEAVDEEGYAVHATPTSLHDELYGFQSYLGPIGDGMMAGEHLDAILAACRSVDNAIVNFTSASAANAKSKKARLRHKGFSAAYVMQRSAAISQLVSFVHGGGLSFRRVEGPDFGLAIREAWRRAETPGEFYFLIGLTKFTAHATETASQVAKLLKDVRSHPYHLQLSLIDFAQYLRDAEEPYRTEIIEALNAALDKLGVMMNSIIFEALDRLGALEEDAQSHVPVIRNEIQSALEGESTESDETAFGLFSCQFDHPFDSAYWEEIQALDVTRKKRLLMNACRGARRDLPLFVGILIRQLAEFNDPNIAPLLIRWTALPDKKSFMPQEALEIFVIAHQVLGKLGAELPAARGTPTNEADNALLACGELFYWASRTETEDNQTSRNTLAARSALLKRCQHTAAGALQLTTSCMLSSDGNQISLVAKYPAMSVLICRRALERRDVQVSYFDHRFDNDSDSIARFAIQVLGAFGGIDDLLVLRDLCDDERCGTSSIDAIRMIEEGISFQHD